MSIKQKFKELWGKLRRKNSEPEISGRNKTDAELSAEEVLVEEIYPEGRVTVARRKQIRDNAETAKKSNGRRTRTHIDNGGSVDKICGKADVVPPYRAGRSRPTNPEYEMIDPSGDSADTSKS